MELTIDQALQKATKAHKSGKLQTADKLYTAILKLQPNHPDANHNLGIMSVDIGKLQESLPFFKKALETNPYFEQFWLSYINTLIKLEQISDAKSAFNQAKKTKIKSDAFDQLEKKFNTLDKRITKTSKIQDPPQYQLQSFINLYKQQKFQQALEVVRLLLIEFPASFILYNYQGISNAELKQFDSAIKSFKQAIKIKPDYAEAHYNAGKVLQEKGELETAIDSYTKAIKIKPKWAQALSNIGNALREKGELGAAIVSLNEAIKIEPNFAEAHYNIGKALQEKGELETAIDSYTKAIKIKPDYLQAYNNMGITLKKKGAVQAAIDIFKKVLEINPNFAEAHSNLGLALNDTGNLEAALKSYKKAIKIKPDFAEAHSNMGNALKEKGNLSNALGSYTQALKFKSNYTEVHRNLSLITKYDLNNKYFLQMLNLSKDPSLSSSQRCNISFGLAKAYEDIGDLEKSFYHYAQGNAFRKRFLNYDIKHDIKLFTHIKLLQKDVYKKDLLPGEKHSNLRPIFILGMPRSGTTLVEQIISSHSKVTGAGELNIIEFFGGPLIKKKVKISIENLLNFQEKYLLELQKKANGKAYVTDKMPQNFKYIGLICSAFPQAKIIHVKRDPAATCWSNYKQYFPSETYGYCYDLQDTVKYYNLYQDLMQFWQERYSDRIYHLDYDKLTTNQEEQTRQLIDYLELKWQDTCLSPQNNKRSVKTASNLQVRQKVYQGSSKSWRQFEPFLKGIFNIF